MALSNMIFSEIKDNRIVSNMIFKEASVVFNTRCVVGNIDPIKVQFDFYNVSPNHSLKDFLANKNIRERITGQILETCINAGCLDIKEQYRIENIVFRINYESPSSDDFHTERSEIFRSGDGLAESLIDILDTYRDENIRQIIIEALIRKLGNDCVPGALPITNSNLLKNVLI